MENPNEMSEEEYLDYVAEDFIKQLTDEEKEGYRTGKEPRTSDHWDRLRENYIQNQDLAFPWFYEYLMIERIIKRIIVKLGGTPDPHKESRSLPAVLTDAQCRDLLQTAASYDLDLESFLRMICVELLSNDAARAELDPLLQKAKKKYRGRENGFLSWLQKRHLFSKAVESMFPIWYDDYEDEEMVAKAKAWLDQIYAEYRNEVGEKADSYKVAMDKMQKAYQGTSDISGWGELTL